MKARYILAAGILILSAVSVSRAQSVNNWLGSGPLSVSAPSFISGPSITGEEFGDKLVLSNPYIDMIGLAISNGSMLKWNDALTRQWTKLSAPEDEYLTIKPAEGVDYQVAYIAFYITSEGLYDYKLEVESPQMFEVFLDAKKITSSYKTEDENVFPKKTATLKLDRGKFLVIIKSLYAAGDENDWLIKAEFTGNDYPEPLLSLNPTRGMDIHDVLEGTKLRSLSISPDGELIMVNYSRINTETGKNHSWTEVKKSSGGEILQSFRQAGTTGFRWMPRGQKLYYSLKSEKGSSLWVYDFKTGREYPVLENVEELSGASWSDDESFIIYGLAEKEKNAKKSSLLYMDELGDRTFSPERSLSLYRYDVNNGTHSRLTYGKESTSLEDISRDGRFIVFSISTPNPSVPPFRSQSMFIMNLADGTCDTLWNEMPYGGSADFSPDGSKLLVTGPPDCFGETGKITEGQPYSNERDIQLYIYDLESGLADPISADFHPSVGQAVWHPEDGKIYLTCDEEVYERLYCWEPKKRNFRQIETLPDIIRSFSVAGGSLTAAYSGNSLGSPMRAWLLDLKSGKSTIFDDTEFKSYRNVKFGESRDWNFEFSDGTTIKGYYIMPPGFDPSKKYPLIVNYYGGVTPVGKSFGGRYPADIWACEGFVVYVPQPCGAIGFGQGFSSRHQNDWGDRVADEIIEGTKKFTESHAFIDPDRIGCIGASYGGFTTMLLQTRTDIFACAISHAGISSISTYWREGYWGYWYNTVASQGSFPWNRKDIYVDQSPLFSADKINTPILLLHGSKDTNVPVGESLQLWVGLKILGKPVEMVQVEGEDHWIITYSKRIEWHNTIMAWFDKWLKDKNHDWKKLFPESKL